MLFDQKSNQGAMQRNTVHTTEDPKQDVNSNYCWGIFRLQTSSEEGGGGGKPLQQQCSMTAAEIRERQSHIQMAGSWQMIVIGQITDYRSVLVLIQSKITDTAYFIHSIGLKCCTELNREKNGPLNISGKAN